jgi:hypothetical protein
MACHPDKSANGDEHPLAALFALSQQPYYLLGSVDI